MRFGVSIFLIANGSLRPCIPACPDSHPVALRLHLPLFPCGLFPGFSSSSYLPSVVFPLPYGFLAGLWFSLKFLNSGDFVAFSVLRLGVFSNSKDFPAIPFRRIPLSLPPRCQWFSAALHSGLSRFPLYCLAGSCACVSLRFVSWVL
jgi:hypothetical protein